MSKEQLKRGRKPALTPDEGTLSTIRALGKIGCTHREVAAVLGVAYRTWMTFKQTHPEAEEAMQEGWEIGKSSLRRSQFRLAEKNAAMAIWLGKQYLGQREPHDFADMTPEEYARAVKRALRDAESSTVPRDPQGDDAEVV